MSAPTKTIAMAVYDAAEANPHCRIKWKDAPPFKETRHLKGRPNAIHLKRTFADGSALYRYRHVGTWTPF